MMVRKINEPNPFFFTHTIRLYYLKEKPMKNYFTKSQTSSRLSSQIQKITLATLSQHASGIVLIGLADDNAIKTVGGRQGARFAPAVIRQQLLKLITPHNSIPIYDLGDVEGCADSAKTHAHARKNIAAIHKAKHIPIVLGGGHDLAFPEARALLDSYAKGSGFLNVDAHLDLRPTTNGITSGSPWYLLLQENDFKKQKCELIEFGIQPHCNSAELYAIAKQHKVKILSLSQLKERGVVKSFLATLNTLAKHHKSIQVSLDIDSVRASEAPGCSAPQVLGFSAEDFIRFSELAGRQKNVRSFGIYEVSPPLDFDAHTSRLAAHAILAFIHGVALRKNRV
jgi:formimidoylglutamase